MRPLLSGNWYRVRDLRPRLRGHVQIHRHAYRGMVWYVFEDRQGGKHHRFNFAAYRVINLMDGRRDMRAIWDLLNTELDDDTPTQDDIIRLLGQLHGADLVQADVSPDVAELFERGASQRRRKWMGRLGNPIALRLPLFDPDALLGHLLIWVRPWLGRTGAALWLLVVLPALVILPSRWGELSSNFSERLLATDNLLLLVLLFPLVKIAHELGHGLVCKMRGGEVHETGVMLLVFYPVPYVDVSSASAFVGKWQRALVGAAGMLTELFIAALAFYLWLLLEPGVARAAAYNVAVLASVTTLFFNANPLLRYDGYFILADVLEIPNLAVRASRHWQYLAERWVFGVRQSEPPQATAGERRWFIAYAPLSFAYRLLVSMGIAIFVAQQYFFVGVSIALWTLGQSLVWPLFKGLRALATQPQFSARRQRVRTVLGGIAVALVLGLFVLPMPYHTTSEGVIWPPEQAILRVQSGGFVRQVLATTGSTLQPGQAVIESVEPGLMARIAEQEARVEEISVQFDAAWGDSQARAQQFQQALLREQASLDRLLVEAGNLTLRSTLAGRLLLDNGADLPGRYLRKGDVVGYVRTDDAPLVRVALPQSEVDAVRLATRRIEVRLPQAIGTSWPADLVRSVPAAGHQLPSAVLGSQGGGQLAIDPRDEKGLSTLESMFEFELELPLDVPHELLGNRVHVRFEHDSEPLGLRMLRGLRRAFLSYFEV